MPIYEYECKECGHRFDEMQKFSDEPLKKCPKCNKKKLRRLISPAGLIFKGTGWTQKGL
jgi:putative FmdB family regulatory protein